MRVFILALLFSSMLFGRFAGAQPAIGFGVMVPIGSPLLTFELRYSQSLLNLGKVDENPSPAAAGLRERFRSTEISIIMRKVSSGVTEWIRAYHLYLRFSEMRITFKMRSKTYVSKQ
jgi:hypothetical protein